MKQKQHSVQEAYYKSFRDRGKIWVYPKDGRKPFRKPTSWCTTETDFQSASLEEAQSKIIENHGIKAIWHLLTPGRLSEEQYKILLAWIALHLTRNQKARATFFRTNQEYEKEFPVEFGRQLAGLHLCFRVADVYASKPLQFLVTSDNPLVEFEVERGGKSILILPISPSMFVQLSFDGQRWEHEKLPVEDFVNTAICASAFKYIFSDRDQVDITNYKKTGELFGFKPVLEIQSLPYPPV